MLVDRVSRKSDQDERDHAPDKSDHSHRLVDGSLGSGRSGLTALRRDIEFESVGYCRTTTSRFLDLHTHIIALFA